MLKFTLNFFIYTNDINRQTLRFRFPDKNN